VVAVASGKAGATVGRTLNDLAGRARNPEDCTWADAAPPTCE
jgi:hypothetical protein